MGKKTKRKSPNADRGPVGFWVLGRYTGALSHLRTETTACRRPVLTHSLTREVFANNAGMARDPRPGPRPRCPYLFRHTRTGDPHMSPLLTGITIESRPTFDRGRMGPTDPHRSGSFVGSDFSTGPCLAPSPPTKAIVFEYPCPTLRSSSDRTYHLLDLPGVAASPTIVGPPRSVPYTSKVGTPVLETLYPPTLFASKVIM